MGLTRQQFRQLLANTGACDAARGGAARGTGRNEHGRMNLTEAAYSGYLESLRVADLIAWWGFETVKLRLANRTWYTPDFTIIVPTALPVEGRVGDNSSRVEFHEVKGFWRDDARVKFKVAAEQFPWARFIAVKREGGSWQTETA